MGADFHAVYARSNYGERERIPEAAGRKLMDVVFR